MAYVVIKASWTLCAASMVSCSFDDSPSVITKAICWYPEPGPLAPFSGYTGKKIMQMYQYLHD